MAEDVHVPITEATMVTTGTKHDVATGDMDDPWRVWMRLSNDQKTWVRWKTMWSGAFSRKTGARQAYRHRLQQHGESVSGDGGGQQDGRGDRQLSKLRRPEKRHCGAACHIQLVPLCLPCGVRHLDRPVP